MEEQEFYLMTTVSSAVQTRKCGILEPDMQTGMNSTHVNRMKLKVYRTGKKMLWVIYSKIKNFQWHLQTVIRVIIICQIKETFC